VGDCPDKDYTRTTQGSLGTQSHASLEEMIKTRGTNERKLIQAKKALEMSDRVLTAAIRRCHIELARKKGLRDVEASKDAVEAAWEEYNQAIARYCMYAGGDSIGRKEIEEQPEEVRRALYEWKVLTDMMEQVVDKAEEYLESATKENSRDELYEDEDGGNVLDAEVEVRLWVEQLSAMNKVNEMALEVSAMNKVNEVALEVSTVDNVNEVSVSEVNVNDVNKVNQEPTMNEDSGEVCDAKEEMRKGKPPEVLLRSDFVAKVQVEKSGMKEVKNLEDVKKVEKGLPLSRSREVKGIEDLIMKTKEESRHASWDPGEIVDAEAQMFNMKVEVMPNGDVNAKALFDAMSLFNFVRLYTLEVLVLVARNAVRFVDVNPLSSRCFAESFLPILSDYG